MTNLLVLAAGYVLSYGIHTPQGRETARKLIGEGMRQLGGLEKAVANAVKPAAAPKKEKKHDRI